MTTITKQSILNTSPTKNWNDILEDMVNKIESQGYYNKTEIFIPKLISDLHDKIGNYSGHHYYIESIMNEYVMDETINDDLGCELEETWCKLYNENEPQEWDDNGPIGDFVWNEIDVHSLAKDYLVNLLEVHNNVDRTDTIKVTYKQFEQSFVQVGEDIQVKKDIQHAMEMGFIF